jgi:ABC-2 type transport system permease protein
MKVFWLLLRRELGSLFSSLTGYVIIAAVLFLIGISFASLLEVLNNADPTDTPITDLFYQSYFFWLIFLLASPLISMRTFAREKALGTYETLTTAPVSDYQIVLGKFSGVLLFFMLVWSPLLACIGVVRHYSNDVSAFNFGMVASTYLGILLIGGVYMAMGCFASSFTRSQILAAIISFVMGVGLFIISYRSMYGTPDSSWWNRIASHFSLIEHMQDFVRGVVDTRFVVFYLSLMIFFLYLTLKVVESRRWR